MVEGELHCMFVMCGEVGWERTVVWDLEARVGGETNAAQKNHEQERRPQVWPCCLWSTRQCFAATASSKTHCSLPRTCLCFQLFSLHHIFFDCLVSCTSTSILYPMPSPARHGIFMLFFLSLFFIQFLSLFLITH